MSVILYYSINSLTQLQNKAAMVRKSLVHRLYEAECFELHVTVSACPDSVVMWPCWSAVLFLRDTALQCSKNSLPGRRKNLIIVCKSYSMLTAGIVEFWHTAKYFICCFFFSPLWRYLVSALCSVSVAPVVVPSIWVHSWVERWIGCSDTHLSEGKMLTCAYNKDGGGQFMWEELASSARRDAG